MINAIIVDDEPLALDILESHISKIEDINLVARCANALEANKALNEHEVDLMFLDIQMPQLTGIEFLRTLSDPPLVIFTTAYSDYAVEGFNLEAIDYLLKPISFERFLKASNKAISLFKQHKIGEIENSAPDDNFIFIKADKKMLKVFYKDILYIEGLKDYVIIRTETGRVITLQTMKSLETKLPASIFRRIHRSYIINIRRIIAVEGSMIEIMEKGAVKLLPVGKNYKDELDAIIDANKL